MSLYFTTHLTENEHVFLEEILTNACRSMGFDLLYYRKFKEEHVPMYRECKIGGERNRVIKMLTDLEIEFDNANEKILLDGEKVRKYKKSNNDLQK